MIKQVLGEIKERISKGYKGELLFNYRTGNYEVVTWVNGEEGHSDVKVHKLPSSSNVSMLKKIVYPGEFK